MNTAERPEDKFGICFSTPHPTPLRILVAEFARIRVFGVNPRSLATSATTYVPTFARVKILNGVAPHPNPLPGVPERGSCSSAVPKTAWLRTAFLVFTLVTLSAAGLAAQADGARGTIPRGRVFPEEPLRRRDFPPDQWMTYAIDPYVLGMRHLSLAGSWKFRIDPQRVGLKENWQTTELPDTIKLPGTTDEQQKGSPNTNTKLTNHLSRSFPYQGPAWYQREVSIFSDGNKGKRLTLLLERTKSTQVWVDGQACGEQDSLAGPQVYDLSAVLTPGKHRLTILVDNGKKLPVNGGHQLAEDTQTNWNGILGRIELRITDRVWIDDVQVYPNVKEHKVKVRVTLGNLSGAEAAGSLELKIVSWVQRGNLKPAAVPGRPDADTPKRPSVASGARSGDGFRQVSSAFAKAAHGTIVEAEYDLVPDAALWDEFSPNLHTLFVSLHAPGAAQTFVDRKQVLFGLREFATLGTQFTINGKTIFLRGKHEACVFPKTGYAPMDVAGWLSVLEIAKSYGINHYRFHSWCPPEAAFTAADMVGIYLQPELPNFGGDLGKDRAAAEYTRAEAHRIIKAYGNHPSFVMLALGNEMFGGRTVRAEIIQELRQADGRHLYAQASNYDFSNPELAQGDDYWTTFRTKRGADGAVRGSYAHVDAPLGHIQAGPPGTTYDYGKAIADVPVPVIGHEVGQYQTYPNFREIDKYTGVLRAWNFDVFRQRLQAAGMLNQADDFVRASGALSVLCYREEIEAGLRTKGFGGFQLLDLQDFPGQGTALVGILDAFMASKGLIEPDAWREFCSETVPLAIVTKYAWTVNETLTAEVKVAHYGPSAMAGAKVSWTLAEAGGKQLAAGQLPAKDISQGSLVELGRISAALQSAAAPGKLLLTVQIDGTNYKNRYDLWVYPTQVDRTPPAGVTVSRKLDDDTWRILNSGGKVLLLPEPAQLAHAVDGFFASDFWCYPMFKRGNPPGTLGWLCDPKHPALAKFPTESHSNWQWFKLAMHSRAVILDATPADYRPVVQVIDNFERNHKLGVLWETRVGTGKLLVCSIDLPSLQDQPEARQLLASLLAYVGSDRFQPLQELPVDVLQKILAAPLPSSAPNRSATAS
ncbi:MAG: hypothetical protein NTY19_13095 [Planctomycetota bacterium]|nr:hypothetical protein [Planctomycetota bacterium]